MDIIASECPDASLPKVFSLAIINSSELRQTQRIEGPWKSHQSTITISSWSPRR